MYKLNSRNLLIFIAFSSIATTIIPSCSSNLYSLPDPPPKSEWRDNTSEPNAKEREQNLRYIEARASALKLYSALATQDVNAAESLMTENTKEWLTRNGELPLKDVLRPLSPEEIENKSRPNPVELLLAEDLSNISDKVPGIEEKEDAQRVEIFAKQKDGSYRRITMFKTANGQWILNRVAPAEPLESK